MTEKKDPLVFVNAASLDTFLQQAEAHPSLFGENAETLQETIRRHRGATDEDLPTMGRNELVDEIVKLRAGIRAHRDAEGHNLCWWTPELWGLLPEKVEPKPKVPPRGEFLTRCGLYRDSLANAEGLEESVPAEPHDP